MARAHVGVMDEAPSRIAAAKRGGGRAAPDSPSGAPPSRDTRCPSGSGWGEALVAGCRVSKQTRRPAAHASKRETPDERRRAARADRPLIRETSAGCARRVGWSLGFTPAPSSSSRKARREGNVERRHPDPSSAWRMASKPSGGFSKPSASWARRVDEPDRGSVDPKVVLVDCSGCRSRREAPGPSRYRDGQTAVESVEPSLPDARLGVCSVAKGCPKPARGGKAEGTVAGCR